MRENGYIWFCHNRSKDFFLKEIGFISDGWLQHVHNLGSFKTVPVTSYIEILQNVVLYLFNGGGVRCSSEKLTQYKKTLLHKGVELEENMFCSIVSVFGVLLEEVSKGIITYVTN